MMKKIINYILCALALVGSLSLWSCKDNDDDMSKAVLASASSLFFEATEPTPQIIKVVSDANWVAEVPEWVTVEPMSGTAGVTEVKFTVLDNVRDDEIDTPRVGEVVFRGNLLRSRVVVKVQQEGDKFRAGKEYTIPELGTAADGTIVTIKDLIVCAANKTGCIATDGTDFTFISNPVSKVSVGQKISVGGEKQTDSNKFPYVKGEKIYDVASASVPQFEAVDITDKLDSYENTKRVFVSVTGNVDGSRITVDGVRNAVSTSNISDGIEVPNGHKVKIEGIYTGTASPVVDIFITKVEDLGVNEIIYFSDDFEWFEPFSTASQYPAGDHIGTGITATTTTGEANKVQCPNIVSKSYMSNDKTLRAALEEKGYELLWGIHSSKKQGECIYIMRNYLKMGKTAFQAGLTLPKVPEMANQKTVMTFDWCPMKGSGGFDETKLEVVVKTGSNEVKINVPESTLTADDQMQWIPVSIDLTEVDIDANTRITIKSTQWEDTGIYRWFIDNIKIKLAK